MKFPFEIRSGTEFDVVGFGTNAVDFLVRVPEYPAFNSKIELLDHVRSPGGEIATTMAGLSRLGLRTAYAGRFGDDAAGDVGLASLSDDGVDVRFAERISGAQTQVAYIIIDVRNGERTVIWKRDPLLAYAPEEAPLESVHNAAVLHFTPHDVGACIRLAREARSKGVIVSIDIDNIFEGVDELLGLVDILIASAEFPSRLLMIDDHEVALRTMKERYGCAIAGVTLGAGGSLLLVGDRFIRTEGFEVPGGCADTTGAGDAFRVGLLYGLIKGMSVEDAAVAANGVAALKCRSVGARTSLPTEAELEALIAGRLA
jgi:sugar/nucleoside kinase (ribokinase family)